MKLNEFLSNSGDTFYQASSRFRVEIPDGGVGFTVDIGIMHGNLCFPCSAHSVQDNRFPVWTTRSSALQYLVDFADFPSPARKVSIGREWQFEWNNIYNLWGTSS